MKKLFAFLLLSGIISFIPSSLHPFFSSSLSAQIPSNGLVAWYPFNGNANDESGNGNNGTVNGATLTADRFGNTNAAYSFNGVSDFINISLNSITNYYAAGAEITTNVWVNTNDSHGPVVSFQGYGGYEYDFHVGTLADVVQNSGHYGMLLRDNCCGTGNNLFGSAINNGQWQMLTIVRGSDGTLTCYLNGLFDSSSGPGSSGALQFTNPFLNLGSDQAWVVGAANGGCNSCNDLNRRFYSGLMDDVATYNRALTATEIQQLYQDQTGQVQQPLTCNITAPTTTLCAGESVNLSISTTGGAGSSSQLPANLQQGLVAYYPFNGNGNDESGNGNNGTVNGATLTSDRFGNVGSAYGFDGNDWIESLIPQSNAYTISGWIVVNTLSNYNGFLQHKSNCDRGGGVLLAIQQEGNVRLVRENCGVCSSLTCNAEFSDLSATQINPLEWSHIVATSDGINLHKVYLDGVLINSIDNSLSIGSYGNQPFSIGKHHDGSDLFYLSGKADDICIFDRQLSISEIQQLYTTQSYAWNTGATTNSVTVNPTINTTYSCTVTQGNSTCTASIDITVNPVVTNAISATIIEGETYTLGTQTLTTAGTYTEVFTSATGCDSTVTLTLAVEPLLTCNITTPTTTLCAGQNITLSDDGGNSTSGLIYIGNWNNHFYYSNEGSYSIPQILALCQMNGWNLAAITSNEENQFICSSSNFNSTIDFLIAGENPSGNSVFIDGQSLQFVPWGNTEPNNLAGNETYIVLNGCLWYDVISNDVLSRGFIIESPYSLINSVIWSTGATTSSITVIPTNNTTYSCTVTQGNSTCTASIDITVNPAVTNAIIATIIEGESYTLGTQTLTTAGTYTEVFTSAAGCDSTVTLTLAVEPLLTCNITAPTTTLCAGESVNLSISTTGGAVNSNISTYNVQSDELLFDQFIPYTSSNNAQISFLEPGEYYIQVSGTWCGGSCWNGPREDAAYDFYNNNIVAINYAFTINEYCPQDVNGCSHPRPVPDEYNSNHIYYYPYTSMGGPLTIYNVADECCWGDNQGGLNFKLYRRSNYSSINWSTGATTNSITVTPTANSTYSCTVTSGSQTCTASVDITVSPQQTFYADADGDGFGNPNALQSACEQPVGFVSNANDCNDNEVLAFVGATDICDNGIDEDCSGADSTCIVLGCTDVAAFNFNPAANTDDGSCIAVVLGCTDASAFNYNSAANTDDGSCIPFVLGCTNSSACNFNELANTDDDSCILPQTETCNGLDDNCDGQVDEGLTLGSVTATSVTTALYPTCSGNALKSANLNNGANSPIIDGNGLDLWYSMTAQYNTLRASLSAAFGDNEIRLYSYNNGCFELMETEHEVYTASTAATGNQVLITDDLLVGQTYYIAVHNISGPMNTSAKMCFNHFVGSTCDHYYSNNTGIYPNVCTSFKAQYKGNATNYIFDILSATQNNANLNITPWSYTTTTANSVVPRLGTIFPVNMSNAAKVYTLRIPVIYAIPDAAGNYTSITANATTTCTVTLNAELPIALRAADRCPNTKTTSSSISVDRTICGAQRYEWEFTQQLPSVQSPVTVLGGLNTTVFFLNNVPGMGTGKTYNVRVRPIHANGEVGNWGTAQCLKTGTSGMVMQSESDNESGVWANNYSPIQAVTLFPNPTSTGHFTLMTNASEEEVKQIVITDITGKMVFQSQVVMNGNSVDVELGDLATGMYLVMVGEERLRLIVE